MYINNALVILTVIHQKQGFKLIIMANCEIKQSSIH